MKRSKATNYSTLDLETASTIAAVHSKLKYCSSFYLGLSKTELNWASEMMHSCSQLLNSRLLLLLYRSDTNTLCIYSHVSSFWIPCRANKIDQRRHMLFFDFTLRHDLVSAMNFGRGVNKLPSSGLYLTMCNLHFVILVICQELPQDLQWSTALLLCWRCHLLASPLPGVWSPQLYEILVPLACWHKPYIYHCCQHNVCRTDIAHRGTQCYNLSQRAHRREDDETWQLLHSPETQLDIATDYNAVPNRCLLYDGQTSNEQFIATQLLLYCRGTLTGCLWLYDDESCET